MIGSGAGIPAALGVNFAAGMAGSLAEQKIAKGRLSPVRAAVDGVFNAIGGKIYTTNSLKNAKSAFIVLHPEWYRGTGQHFQNQD